MHTCFRLILSLGCYRNFVSNSSSHVVFSSSSATNIVSIDVCFYSGNSMESIFPVVISLSQSISDVVDSMIKYTMFVDGANGPDTSLIMNCS